MARLCSRLCPPPAAHRSLFCAERVLRRSRWSLPSFVPLRVPFLPRSHPPHTRTCPGTPHGTHSPCFCAQRLIDCLSTEYAPRAPPEVPLISTPMTPPTTPTQSTPSTRKYYPLRHPRYPRTRHLLWPWARQGAVALSGGQEGDDVEPKAAPQLRAAPAAHQAVRETNTSVGSHALRHARLLLLCAAVPALVTPPSAHPDCAWRSCVVQLVGAGCTAAHQGIAEPWAAAAASECAGGDARRGRGGAGGPRRLPRDRCGVGQCGSCPLAVSAAVQARPRDAHVPSKAAWMMLVSLPSRVWPCPSLARSFISHSHSHARCTRVGCRTSQAGCRDLGRRGAPMGPVRVAARRRGGRIAARQPAPRDRARAPAAGAGPRVAHRCDRRSCGTVAGGGAAPSATATATRAPPTTHARTRARTHARTHTHAHVRTHPCLLADPARLMRFVAAVVPAYCRHPAASPWCRRH
jgi:hypothetical protein